MPKGSDEEGVHETIDLNFISDEEIDRAIEQADKVEKVAKRIKKAKLEIPSVGEGPLDLAPVPMKIKKVKREIPPTGEGPSDLAPSPNTETLPSDVGGKVYFKQGKKIYGSVKGQDNKDNRTPAPIDAKTGQFLQNMEKKYANQAKVVQKLIDEVKSGKLTLGEMENHKRKIQKLTLDVSQISKTTNEKIQEIKNVQQTILSNVNQGLSAVKNPLGFAQGKLFATAAKFALPVAAVLAIAETVSTMVLAQFEPGGLFDVRKVILDEAREFSFQSDLIDIDRGTILFASTATLSQRGPDFANTESKVYGHLKDVLRNAGQ